MIFIVFYKEQKMFKNKKALITEINAALNYDISYNISDNELRLILRDIDSNQYPVYWESILV